jgi:hypothetical protein
MAHRRARGTRVHLGALVILSGALMSCAGKAVNIGDSDPRDGLGPIYASSPPPTQDNVVDAARPTARKLVDQEIGVEGFTADAGHVYWIANTWNESTAWPASTRSVRSCATTDCRSTLKVLPIPQTASEGGQLYTISVNATRLLWNNFESEYKVSFCPRDNCSAFDTLGFGGRISGFNVDATRIFFNDANGLVSCSIADCAGTAARFPITFPQGEPTFGGWTLLAMDDEYLYVGDSRVLRAKKEGTDAVETIAQGAYPGLIAVHGGTAFWAESGPLGRVRACPVTGCVGEPRLIVAGRNDVQGLIADDENVYMTESLGGENTPQLPHGSARLSRCAVTGCAEPTVLVESEGLDGSVLMDDAFVYFGGRKCTGDPVIGEACSYIGAIRK